MDNEHGDGIEFGVAEFKVGKDEHAGIRFRRLHLWLAAYALHAYTKKPVIDRIAYEMPHHRGGAATRVLVGLAMHVESFGAKHGIPVFNIHSATIKKFVTGSGKAKKPEMIATVMERWPELAGDPKQNMTGRSAEVTKGRRGTVLEEDEADAIALLMCAHERCSLLLDRVHPS